MTNPLESTPQAAEVRPTIETIDQAATELTRLYTAFDQAAVDLTPEYLQGRLTGERGITWNSFPIAPQRRVPLLDSVMRYEGKLELGAGITLDGSIMSKYRLAVGPVPGATDETEQGIFVRRPRVGFDPGEEYAVVAGKVLKAGYVLHGTTPSVGRDNRLGWLNSNQVRSDIFQELPAVDTDLTKLIDQLRGYEIA